MPDRSEPHEPRERLVTLTVERMDGLRIDRIELRVVHTAELASQQGASDEQ